MKFVSMFIFQHVASLSDTGGIELLDKEFKLEDDVQIKVIKVMIVIEAKTGIEKRNVDTIDIDDDVTLTFH